MNTCIEKCLRSLQAHAQRLKIPAEQRCCLPRGYRWHLPTAAAAPAGPQHTQCSLAGQIGFGAEQGDAAALGAEPRAALGVLRQPCAGGQVCCHLDFHVSSYKAAQNESRLAGDKTSRNGWQREAAWQSPAAAVPRASLPTHLLPAMVIRTSTAMNSPTPGESVSDISGGRRSVTFSLGENRGKALGKICQSRRPDL